MFVKVQEADQQKEDDCLNYRVGDEEGWGTEDLHLKHHRAGSTPLKKNGRPIVADVISPGKCPPLGEPQIEVTGET